jgi:hypothetical protein
MFFLVALGYGHKAKIIIEGGQEKYILLTEHQTFF